MSYLYHLAGENLELAKEEVKGLLRSQGTEEDIQRMGRLAVSEAEPEQPRRLSLVHEVAEKIEETDRDDMNFDHRPEGTFRVRAKSIESNEDVKEYESSIGSLLETQDNSVDLEEPEEDLRAYITKEKVILGKLIEDIPRELFKKRKNQERPFSSPISLDPVVARTLVNLSGLQAGEHVLDPFCGTGGILIEAGLCGIGVHGTDSSQEMVEGTRDNLEEYGIINHDISQKDVSDTSSEFENADAVITDLPYGKASLEKGEPVKEFLKKLESGTPAVFMYNEDSLGDYKPEFELYVHSNLTRYIYRVNF